MFCREWPVAKAFREAHPQNHYALAWLAWCEANRNPGDLEVLSFPVHFCVLTKNPQAHKAATLDQCRKECQILNETFRNIDGKALARFEFRGYTSYADAKKTQCELLAFGDRADGYAFARNIATVNLAARQFIEFYGLSPSAVLVDTCATTPHDVDLQCEPPPGSSSRRWYFLSGAMPPHH